MTLPQAINELEFGHGSFYGKEEEDVLLEVLRAGAPSCGPWVKRFEGGFAKYCGSGYGLAVTSGTTGLQLAMIAAGVGPGDEVITTPVSWIATANAAAVLGAKVVFADVDARTLNLDPASVEEKDHTAHKGDLTCASLWSMCRHGCFERTGAAALNSCC